MKMPKRIEKPKEEDGKKAPPAQAVAASTYEHMRALGYLNYTPAVEFEFMDLDTDPRSFPIANKIDAKLIREDGGRDHIWLGFLGRQDEPLFLIDMRKEEMMASITKKPKESIYGYVGLEFFGVTRRFGPVGIIALPIGAYAEFVKTAQQ